MRNYLRARGEYNQAKAAELLKLELPPRTRRIQGKWDPGAGDGGTTSAHAENTKHHHHQRNPIRNYLRARGEYTIMAGSTMLKAELPPRTRRIPRKYYTVTLHKGTTSAHAENT